MEERIERLSAASSQPLFDTPTSGFLVMDTKTCKRCERIFPLTKVYYYVNNAMSDRFDPVCKECKGYSFQDTSIYLPKDGYRKCTLCDRDLPYTPGYFFRHHEGIDGLRSYCKECDGKPFGIKKKPIVKVDDGYKHCYQCDTTFPETEEYFYKAGPKASQDRRFYSACIACRTKRTTETRERDRIRAKKERESDPDKYRKRMREYNKDRRDNDSEFKLKGNLRHRIWMALKGNVKSEGTMKLIGCSVPELMNWLSMQFIDGMTWDNYGQGGWQVDHIKPCAMFDLSDPKQQKECFNYKNLQPLWAYDNDSKDAIYKGKNYRRNALSNPKNNKQCS